MCINFIFFVKKKQLLLETDYRNNNQPGSIWPCRKAQRMDCHWPGNATSEASPCLQVVCAHDITPVNTSNTLQNRMNVCRPWSPSSQSVVRITHISRHICGKRPAAQGLAIYIGSSLQCAERKKWKGSTEGFTLNLERLGTPKGANVAKNSTRKRQLPSNLDAIELSNNKRRMSVDTTCYAWCFF